MAVVFNVELALNIHDTSTRTSAKYRKVFRVTKPLILISCSLRIKRFVCICSFSLCSFPAVNARKQLQYKFNIDTISFFFANCAANYSEISFCFLVNLSESIIVQSVHFAFFFVRKVLSDDVAVIVK